LKHPPGYHEEADGRTEAWFCKRYQTTYTGIKVELEQNLEENDIRNPLKKIVIFKVMREGTNTLPNTAKRTLSISL
jgi:hypothetical protein